MKIQKSSIPYVILLVGLLIGIPVADQILLDNSNTNTVTIQVEQEIYLTDSNITKP